MVQAGKVTVAVDATNMRNNVFLAVRESSALYAKNSRGDCTCDSTISIGKRMNQSEPPQHKCAKVDRIAINPIVINITT